MIFTERTIMVANDSATINKPLILYRGDKNIELKITIAESQFKFRNTDASNVIETTDASYAQLVINTPYNSPIFSDVAATKNGAVIFVITEAMIDEIREVGAYEIQIRLLDDNKQSRASIPPVSNAIEIREPIAIEDGSAVDSNAVNVAKVNRALTTTSAPLEAFDSQGNYIKKTWGDGDPITDAALNKMEAGIEGVNQKANNIPTKTSQLTNDSNYTTTAEMTEAINNASLGGANNINVDNCNFFTKFYNVYDNESVNDLGLNNSGTMYPLPGAYASDYIELKKYVYADKIGFVSWYDENKSYISFDGSIKVAKKLNIPRNAKYFCYEVRSENISTASIYNVDEELPEFPPKTKLANTYLDINFINNAITERNKYTTTIACYGDSLTEGSGSTNAGVYSYPVRLEGIINANAGSYQVTVHNRGIGGNISKAIIAKSGCYADMVEPFTIPADTTPVAITKNGLLANDVGGTISIRNGVNPVTIGGIEGDLSYENGTYKFARLKAGEEVQITRPVQILPSASKTDKNAILIICVGTNDADKTEANYPPKLIQRIRRMIEYLDCKKFIVLGLTVEEKESVNPALEEEFGANFLDIHKYLINYGLSDNGLTATNEDLQDINNGLIPRQIRVDSVHYNDNGYYSKAMGVYLKGKDLGYWK